MGTPTQVRHPVAKLFWTCEGPAKPWGSFPAARHLLASEGGPATLLARNSALTLWKNKQNRTRYWWGGGDCACRGAGKGTFVLLLNFAMNLRPLKKMSTTTTKKTKTKQNKGPKQTYKVKLRRREPTDVDGTINITVLNISESEGFLE